MKIKNIIIALIMVNCLFGVTFSENCNNFYEEKTQQLIIPSEQTCCMSRDDSFLNKKLNLIEIDGELNIEDELSFNLRFQQLKIGSGGKLLIGQKSPIIRNQQILEHIGEEKILNNGMISISSSPLKHLKIVRTTFQGEFSFHINEILDQNYIGSFLNVVNLTSQQRTFKTILTAIKGIQLSFSDPLPYDLYILTQHPFLDSEFIVYISPSINRVELKNWNIDGLYISFSGVFITSPFEFKITEGTFKNCLFKQKLYSDGKQSSSIFKNEVDIIDSTFIGFNSLQIDSFVKIKNSIFLNINSLQTNNYLKGSLLIFKQTNIFLIHPFSRNTYFLSEVIILFGSLTFVSEESTSLPLRLEITTSSVLYQLNPIILLDNLQQIRIYKSTILGIEFLQLKRGILNKIDILQSFIIGNQPGYFFKIFNPSHSSSNNQIRITHSIFKGFFNSPFQIIMTEKNIINRTLNFVIFWTENKFISENDNIFFEYPLDVRAPQIIRISPEGTFEYLTSISPEQMLVYNVKLTKSLIAFRPDKNVNIFVQKPAIYFIMQPLNIEKLEQSPYQFLMITENRKDYLQIYNQRLSAIQDSEFIIQLQLYDLHNKFSDIKIEKFYLQINYFNLEASKIIDRYISLVFVQKSVGIKKVSIAHVNFSKNCGEENFLNCEEAVIGKQVNILEEQQSIFESQFLVKKNIDKNAIEFRIKALLFPSISLMFNVEYCQSGLFSIQEEENINCIEKCPEGFISCNSNCVFEDSNHIQNNCNCQIGCLNCSGKCIHCEEGYVQYQDQCTRYCPFSSPYNGKKCLECIDDCPNQDIGQLCDDHLEQSELLSIICNTCSSGQFRKEGECKNCQQEGCSECFGDGQYDCVLCQPGFSLRDGVCRVNTT